MISVSGAEHPAIGIERHSQRDADEPARAASPHPPAEGSAVGQDQEARVTATAAAWCCLLFFKKPF